MLTVARGRRRPLAPDLVRRGKITNVSFPQHFFPSPLHTILYYNLGIFPSSFDTYLFHSLGFFPTAFDTALSQNLGFFPSSFDTVLSTSLGFFPTAFHDIFSPLAFFVLFFDSHKFVVEFLQFFCCLEKWLLFLELLHMKQAVGLRHRDLLNER